MPQSGGRLRSPKAANARTPKRGSRPCKCHGVAEATKAPAQEEDSNALREEQCPLPQKGGGPGVPKVPKAVQAPASKWRRALAQKMHRPGRSQKWRRLLP